MATYIKYYYCFTAFMTIEVSREKKKGFSELPQTCSNDQEAMKAAINLITEKYDKSISNLSGKRKSAPQYCA